MLKLLLVIMTVVFCTVFRVRSLPSVQGLSTPLFSPGCFSVVFWLQNKENVSILCSSQEEFRGAVRCNLSGLCCHFRVLNSLYLVNRSVLNLVPPSPLVHLDAESE